MKAHAPARIVLILLFATLQGKANGIPPPPEAGEPPPSPAGEHAERKPSPAGKELFRPVDRWMERLRHTEPDQYERLKILQEENPEAFRDALRERLAQRRHSRRWHRDRNHRNEWEPFSETPPCPRHPERDHIADLEREITSLARQYQAGEGPRGEILPRMRARLETWLDLKQEYTERQIQRAEIQLDRLRHILKMTRENRERFLERRLDILLGEEPSEP